ncbi:2-dehydropantoate 2-reductase [Streptomyces zagrosensis]|uniref:2-dehydropantoate 2-reductase n=1 Tax=Streptomyces zagrosensis TaxID=1042984 RepID=A0A7W9QG72_9ACTN|nr:2-dehydropantoate 2-reductase [Streptomyces zagrosensis]MBB5939668.1 2-dehydropantoate 2-reductase [Streptomyces zagrosensis]
MPPTAPHSRHRPKIAVMGAGSIGCHLGGSLAGAADVTLIGRPAAMDALREHGLSLTGGGRRVLRVGSSGGPADVRLATRPDAAAGADFVLVTVKSAATADAARLLAPQLTPGTVVVSFQNGLRNTQILDSALDGHPVLAGMVPYNVLRTSPGAFHQGSGGTLMVEDTPRAGPLVRALAGAGLRIEARGDMREVQYAKLLMNLNNAINALSGLPLRDQLGQRAYRECLALSQCEALAAYQAEGIRPARLGPVPARLTPRLLRLPDGLFRRLAAATLAVDAQARSSTWEDLQRGRPTEIDSLQGEVVALAARHALPAPVNTELISLVRRMEAAGPGAGRRWSGGELLAKVTSVR